jgi:hypothetical protein
VAHKKSTRATSCCDRVIIFEELQAFQTHQDLEKHEPQSA